MVDCSGLGISNEKTEEIGCPLAEALRGQGQRGRAYLRNLPSCNSCQHGKMDVKPMVMMMMMMTIMMMMMMMSIVWGTQVVKYGSLS